MLSCAPFTETEVSLCSFICVRTEAQTCTRNSFTTTHTNIPRYQCTDVLVFCVFNALPCKETPQKH